MPIVLEVPWEVCIVVKAQIHPPEHIYSLCSHLCLKILIRRIPLAKSQRVQRHLGSLKGSGGYFVGLTVLQPYCTITGGDNNSPALWREGEERRRRRNGRERGLLGKSVKHPPFLSTALISIFACSLKHFLCVPSENSGLCLQRNISEVGLNFFMFLFVFVTSTMCHFSDTKHPYCHFGTFFHSVPVFHF